MAFDVQSLLQRASQLFRDGHVREGIIAYEHLLDIYPELPNSWFNLAMLQRRARRYGDALGSYQRALDLRIEFPEEVHLQRAVIFSDDLGQSDAARLELHASLALNRDYVPALLNLGNLHEDCGEWDAARSVYSRALELDPDGALPLARMAGLARVSGPDDPLFKRLRAVIAAPSATPADRADLGFALGSALDRVTFPPGF